MKPRYSVWLTSNITGQPLIIAYSTRRRTTAERWAYRRRHLATYAITRRDAS